MGRILLVSRLAIRDIRHRPAETALALLAIGAATAVLTLGLILHGVTANPYQATKAATKGPDLVAQFPDRPNAAALASIPGVTARSGPFPVASAVTLTVRGFRGSAVVEGRTTAAVQVDQPRVTAGGWVRPGGVVLERAFAGALGAGAGDRITLNSRSFTVVGTAVSAAKPPYPELCQTGCMINGGGQPGMIWATEPDARGLAGSFGLTYVVNVTLKNPARAASIVHSNTAIQADLTGWQDISTADALLVTDEQTVLQVGTFMIVLLALASVALLAGGRMIEQTRRVGLLKAVGGTPDLVAGVLLAEHLAIALVAAGAGLLIGWLTAPVLSSPGAGLIGAPNAPSLTPAVAGLVLVVALGVALIATLVPAIRAARTSTVSALATASSGGARRPRRHKRLIALSTRLPVPLLVGLRLAARRPRRSLLTMASAALTTTMAVAVLAFHSTAAQSHMSRHGIANPIVQRDSEALFVATVVLIVLAVVNAVFTGWVTAVDARHASALTQALGATPRQLLEAQAAAQGMAALPGVIAGIPLGILLYSAASHARNMSLPSAGLLVLAALGILAAVVVLAAVPARAVARGSISGVLQSETA
ncbi:MAG TPA: FtsX-like permease family protein [Streptosporangiaceae bacterium]